MPDKNEPKTNKHSAAHSNSSTVAKALSSKQPGDARDYAIEKAGGEKFITAAAILNGIPKAVCPNSRAASRLNVEVRAAEAKALREFAVTHHLLLDGDQFESTWHAQGEMGGAENDIWYDEKTGLVWKRNRIDVMHVSWRQFFDRMLLHNAFYPEAPLRLEGFVDSSAGLCPVFTQPDVHAQRGAQRSEVEPLLRARGYTRTSGENYANKRLLVEDLHDGNVLVDPDGAFQVIDPVLFAVGSSSS